VKGALEQAVRRLATAGSPSPRLDAQLLLGHVTGWSRAELLAHPERILTPSQTDDFEALVARRAAAEPIAYLLGQREFYGRIFKTDRRALIPRPETELLVELGSRAIAGWRTIGIEPVVVDVGTGSGCVAVSIAAETGAAVIGVELARPALELARENARVLGQANRVRFVQSDLLGGLRGPLHVVLANLPYVPNARVLPADVRDYEPPLALFGGARGTELIERLLDEARRLLAPGAELAVELDEQEQAQPVAERARVLYPEADVNVLPDAGGYDRVVRVSLPRGG
jgi:release factor glutamine methyltransferase